MLFKEILGLSHIKNHLTTSVDNGRIPHAQLFIGPHGSGTLPMAIAYSQYILCGNKNSENSAETSCNLKMNLLTHPDLHFAFPVATTEVVKKNPVSSHFMNEWRKFVSQKPYGDSLDWYEDLGIENKQGQIGVDEAKEIVKSLSLKSFEGGYKIMIIWGAEKMNDTCANKLLKLLEEPPSKTIFILIAEDEDAIIQTIKSRCQILHFPPLSESVIAEGLQEKFNLEKDAAFKIAVQADGDFQKAINLFQNDVDDEQFEKWFIDWVRTAFKAKGNKAVINDLLKWSDAISATGRENQKSFLLFCQEFFRQALLMNYGTGNLVFFKPKTLGFQLEKFAPFIHGENILSINKELEDAIYHIERNGNSKIILTDLSIKLTRLLHQKSE